jgi:hypothetical protein
MPTAYTKWLRTPLQCLDCHERTRDSMATTDCPTDQEDEDSLIGA